MLKKLDVLFDKLKKYISVDSAADELGKKFMHDAMPPYLMDTEKLRTSKEGGERLSNGEVIERYYNQNLFLIIKVLYKIRLIKILGSNLIWTQRYAYCDTIA